MISKQKMLERLQTLMDIVDEKYLSCSVADAERLEAHVEESFKAVCRRKGGTK